MLDSGRSGRTLEAVSPPLNIIAVFTVVAPLRLPAIEEVAREAISGGPNPTPGRFALTAPLVRGATARLTVFDPSGRRVAVITGRAGTPLVWDGRDATGALVSPGVYLYRMEIGKHRQAGRVVVSR